MSFVDLNTGKIYGCVKNSHVWWHEKGHIEFHKTDLGNLSEFWQTNIFMIMVLVLPFALLYDVYFLKLFCASSAIAYFCFYLFQEVWCWGYAYRNKEKWIK